MQGKSPFVKPGGIRYPARYMILKQQVWMEKDQGLETKETRKIPNRKENCSCPEKASEYRIYTTPIIEDRFGKRMDLGINENKIIFDDDICVPTLAFKVYDARYAYGVRSLYVSLRMLV